MHSLKSMINSLPLSIYLFFFVVKLKLQDGFETKPRWELGSKPLEKIIKNLNNWIGEQSETKTVFTSSEVFGWWLLEWVKKKRYERLCWNLLPPKILQLLVYPRSSGCNYVFILFCESIEINLCTSGSNVCCVLWCASESKTTCESVKCMHTL